MPLNVCLFSLQRRLREAVQLLEDYKHGTLRPGVTNEQVILLEVGGGGRKVAKSYPLPCSQNHSLSFIIHFCCYIAMWTSGFLEETLSSSPVPWVSWEAWRLIKQERPKGRSFLELMGISLPSLTFSAVPVVA